MVAAGGRAEVRDPALLDELVPVAARLPAGAAVDFLARLERATELVAGNVGPELVVDVLLLAWPDHRRAGRVSDRSEPARPDLPDQDRIRAEALVRGRVQGVGYRVFAARAALAGGLGGWVANEPDGSVRCVVEGPAPRVEAFLKELARGPLGSQVAAVEVARRPAGGGLERFENPERLAPGRLIRPTDPRPRDRPRLEPQGRPAMNPPSTAAKVPVW